MNKKNNFVDMIILINIQARLFIEDKAKILFNLKVPGNIITIKRIFNIKNKNK